MEAHHRVCLHQNGASQSYHHRDYFARWSWLMCSWFHKCVVCKKTLTLSQKRSRPALTYHKLLSNFISRLDLDNSARIWSACRIALTSSKSKQSAEKFVDVSKHFQFSLFWNGKGCSTIFPALQSYKIKSTRDVDLSPVEMSVVVTLYVSNNKKMNINETQSKLHSIGPKLKSNLVTDFDETNG